MAVHTVMPHGEAADGGYCPKAQAALAWVLCTVPPSHSLGRQVHPKTRTLPFDTAYLQSMLSRRLWPMHDSLLEHGLRRNGACTVAEQVLTSSSQNASLVGLAAPLVGPGEISAAHSFVAGLDGPQPAGNATFAIWLRDARGVQIVSDPQVRYSSPFFPSISLGLVT